MISQAAPKKKCLIDHCAIIGPVHFHRVFADTGFMRQNGHGRIIGWRARINWSRFRVSLRSFCCALDCAFSGGSHGQQWADLIRNTGGTAAGWLR